MNRDALPEIDAAILADLERNMADLARLVAIPSVAAQNRGIEECALLVRDLLTERGYRSQIMPTAGNPVVYAEGDGDSERTLLFYNHYDVQPAEPLNLWESEPFTMSRRDGKVFGRGISDDKGHFISRLHALDAVRKVHGGRLPCRVKFVIEGEEEVGSVQMPAFIEANKQLLAADACVWEFGGEDENGRPEQYLGPSGHLLRGALGPHRRHRRALGHGRLHLSERGLAADLGIEHAERSGRADSHPRSLRFGQASLPA